MKLQDIVFRNWYGIKAFVNDIEYITVAGDFLFVAIFRCCFFLYQLSDTSCGGENPLNSVRCLGALYFGNFDKLC